MGRGRPKKLTPPFGSSPSHQAIEDIMNAIEDDNASVSSTSSSSTASSDSSDDLQKVWDLMYEDAFPEGADRRLKRELQNVFNDFEDILGIHCEKNYTCCNTCGYYEIEQKLIEEGHDKDNLNYVFYHIQETERIAKGAPIVHLNHRLTEKVKKQVLEYIALPDSYLQWDGDDGKKMVVNVLYRK
jgi:hypothetical protein